MTQFHYQVYTPKDTSTIIHRERVVLGAFTMGCLRNLSRTHHIEVERPLKSLQKKTTVLYKQEVFTCHVMLVSQSVETQDLFRSWFGPMRRPPTPCVFNTRTTLHWVTRRLCDGGGMAYLGRRWRKTKLFHPTQTLMGPHITLI